MFSHGFSALILFIIVIIEMIYWNGDDVQKSQNMPTMIYKNNIFAIKVKCFKKKYWCPDKQFIIFREPNHLRIAVFIKRFFNNYIYNKIRQYKAIKVSV